MLNIWCSIRTSQIRLSGTLRDDLIFFIYLYQKWIYPTDMKRTNEFGITGEQAQSSDKPAEQVENGAGEPKSVEEKKND